MKISIITVVYNAELYIKDCIESVLNQNYPDIEYIVIDGGSKDNTCAIINNYTDRIHYFISEKDQGMYDGLNKGIAIASGELVGILNADDVLASNDVISTIVHFSIANNADGIYGNLNYVNAVKPSQIVRKWISKQYRLENFNLGWMPAHPTLYLKRELFLKHGNYSLAFGTAADYELMLRFIYRHQVKVLYVNKLLVNMRSGGMSNSSIKQRYLAFKHDFKAAAINELPFPLISIILKKMSKIGQYFHNN